MMVVCGKETLKEVRSYVGDGKVSIETDFFSITISVVLGLLLGTVKIPLPVRIRVFPGERPGGVLIAALVLSYLGKTGPILWHVSEASTRFARQLGLLFFPERRRDRGRVAISPRPWRKTDFSFFSVPPLYRSSPLALTAAVCRWGMKMNMLTLLGLISGGTTCSPALAATTSLSSSNIPNVAYATVYPFAMIFMMLCAQVLASFMV